MVFCPTCSSYSVGIVHNGPRDIQVHYMAHHGNVYSSGTYIRSYQHSNISILEGFESIDTCILSFIRMDHSYLSFHLTFEIAKDSVRPVFGPAEDKDPFHLLVEQKFFKEEEFCFEIR